MSDDGLDFPALNYLLGLVRADIRRHAKGIDSFQPKAGQPVEEAAAAYARMKDSQDFRCGVQQQLRAAIQETARRRTRSEDVRDCGR